MRCTYHEVFQMFQFLLKVYSKHSHLTIVAAVCSLHGLLCVCVKYTFSDDCAH